MQRITAAIAALAIVSSVAGQPPSPYGRGYVRPKNVEHMKKLSEDVWKGTIDRLPHAAETTYDCSGLLGPVKNQAGCGSCWAFDAIAVIEGAFAKAGKRMVLSEQYILSCTRNGGCNGDDHSTVYRWAKSNGVPETRDYGEYEGREGRCNYNDSMKLHTIVDWGYVDGGDGIANTQKLKNAMKAYGPIGVAVAAGPSWDGYRGGVYRGNNRDINHEVVLVGWDDAKLPGRTVWHMRNSWGESWGDHGHMWIEESADGIGTGATFAVVGVQPPSPPEPVDPSVLLKFWHILVAFAAGIAFGGVCAWLIKRCYRGYFSEQ